LLAAVTAQAATVEIGSSLNGAFGNATSTFAQTRAHFSLPAPANAASPVDGTVISWRFIGGGPATPRIIRPSGAFAYTGAGTGSQQSGPGPGMLSAPLPLNLPIKRGDHFGADFPAGANTASRTTPGASVIAWVPPLLDGDSRAPTGGPGGAFANNEFAIGAVVRFCRVPKLKGKKPKAARNELEAADCTVGKVKKTKKRRKKKRVIAQGFTTGTSIADTTPVNFKVSKKRKKGKR
jgi:hypothetical protein